ncbi:MAG: hypothetical protein ABSF83_11635 [Nitrososphaerales archaeon]
MQESRFMTVRKLAALQIEFRGSRRVLLEFGFGCLFMGAVGLAFLLFAKHPTAATSALGVYLFFLGLNYAPLLAYSVSIAVRGSAKREAARELAHQDVYRRKYGVQQALILVPLAIVALSVVQEVRGQEDDDEPPAEVEVSGEREEPSGPGPTPSVGEDLGRPRGADGPGPADAGAA